jgi:hypothetical protein
VTERVTQKRGIQQIQQKDIRRDAQLSTEKHRSIISSNIHQEIKQATKRYEAMIPLKSTDSSFKINTIQFLISITMKSNQNISCIRRVED